MKKVFLIAVALAMAGCSWVAGTAYMMNYEDGQMYEVRYFAFPADDTPPDDRAAGVQAGDGGAE